MNKFKLLFLTVALLLGHVGVANAAWSGSGNGEQHDGVWYALYSTSEAHFSTISSKEYTISVPGASLSYDAECVPIIGVYGGDLKVAQYVNGSYSDAIYSKQPPKNSYQNYSGIGLDLAATKVKLYTEVGATGYKYFKNVFVTMAQYMEDASKSSIAFGDKKVQDEAVSDNFTIAHCNIPAMTYAINNNGGDEATIQDVTVAFSDNSQEGYYSTATITVTYTPTHVGTLNANLVISAGSYGSKTIALTGSTSKYDQTVVWNDSLAAIDDTLQNIATAPVDLTFTSSDATVIDIVDGKLIATGAGTATITASNEGSDYYNAVSSTHEIVVKARVLLSAAGGVGDTVLYLNLGDSMPAGIAAPTYEHYIFQGYYDYMDDCYYNADMTSNMTWNNNYNDTLTARWTAVKYNIVWLNEDSTLIDTTQVPYGEVPTHADPVKEATAQYSYSFLGWTPEITVVTGDTTYLSLGFDSTAVPYTITYVDSLGAQNPNPTTYTCETETFALQSLTMEGYTFLGWFNGDTQVTSIAKGTTGDITLTAGWEKLPSALQEVGVEQQTQKFFRAGQLYILKNGQLYNAAGQRH